MYLLALCAAELLRWWWTAGRKWSALLRDGFLTGAPGLVGATYFLLQRIQLGWFLFPRHVNAAGFDGARFFHQFFEGYGSQVTVFQGHAIFSLIAVAGLIALIWKNKAALRDKRTPLVAMLLIMLFLIAFSAINFYNSARYILCVYPLWFLMVGWLLQQVLGKLKIVQWASVAGMVGVHLFYLITLKGNGDTQPGYVHRVRAHQQGAQWLVEHGYAGKPLLTHFLMGWQLRSAAPGYVPVGGELVPAQEDNPDAVIVLTDHEPDAFGYRALCGKLLVRFEDGPAWIEIWERKPVQ
jgi:hypothetical protein